MQIWGRQATNWTQILARAGDVGTAGGTERTSAYERSRGAGTTETRRGRRAGKGGNWIVVADETTGKKVVLCLLLVAHG